ncbi:hypothetical protein A2852_00650 [Candidatus Adlerbacteria bacterium RIFCSPHIGHO2_01_FULL_54_23]|uniref:Protease PrsW n=1 Tax=Candidatus Adlerbacteria bacterium RIFCSPLOWO2_01_FULL_54_16 TaxID=1797244 RepID=A0A1F4XZX9_9BACT|nr:MAG: hypothetical protein A2852_00650 [Candidatus Adlerbacteria bacterium RIFCSPHIGHO2_01_FULL_54_23]OGC87280.1 MAG: hypothetical protein A3B33_00690 [Candidatus Adlerbacteria bacterium RIFCSPLOWO2_01_FULL_54_16]
MADPLIFVAVIGGVLPALLWLFFWLREDRCEPEPRRYIIFAFLAGMAAVPLVLPLERQAMQYYSGTVLLLAWAALEEIFKFGAAYIGALRSRAFDEPLDALIYLVTAALGFAALENTFFLITPLQQGDILRSVVMGDLRFVGATLLHTLASATVGLSLALSYYKPALERKLYALAGVILAIFLHLVFNFFILQEGSGATFWMFLVIWVGIVGVFLMTERIKQPSRDYC